MNFTVSEAEGFVEGCVVLDGGMIDRSLAVDLFTVDGTATGNIILDSIRNFYLRATFTYIIMYTLLFSSI